MGSEKDSSEFSIMGDSAKRKNDKYKQIKTRDRKRLNRELMRKIQKEIERSGE